MPEDAESTRTAELARTRYPSDSTPAIIVFHNPGGLTDENVAAAEQVNNQIAAMTGANGSNVSNVVSIFTAPPAREEFVSPDETTMTMIVNITGSSADDAYSDRIDAIRDVTDTADEGDLQVNVSGPGGLISDLVSVFANINSFLLIVTVSLVLVLLIIIYRSPTRCAGTRPHASAALWPGEGEEDKRQADASCLSSPLPREASGRGTGSKGSPPRTLANHPPNQEPPIITALHP